jgi:hypothetical protein
MPEEKSAWVGVASAITTHHSRCWIHSYTQFCETSKAFSGFLPLSNVYQQYQHRCTCTRCGYINCIILDIQYLEVMKQKGCLRLRQICHKMKVSTNQKNMHDDMPLHGAVPKGHVSSSAVYVALRCYLCNWAHYHAWSHVMPPPTAPWRVSSTGKTSFMGSEH